ncbi:unnamed protein product, partial [Didymodactylos carnosus]
MSTKQSVEFKLFAPNVTQVSLLGTFSQWQPIPMQKSENDDGYFRTKIGLEDGQYEYTFRVKPVDDEKNDLVDIIDPYATAIDPTKNVGLVTIVQGKRQVDSYQWQHDGNNELLPQNNDLIIYEIFVADFTEGGTFNDIVPKLDYLCSELGVNCIELMPVSECGEGHDWGYATRHFFSVQTTYGKSEDLKHLIDECHKRKMRVMIDAVFNHCHVECPLRKIDKFYWFYKDPHHPDHPDELWGPEFNYAYEDERLKLKPAWNFIWDVIEYWTSEFHIDGWRFDAVKQIESHDVLRYFDEKSKQLVSSTKKPFFNVGEYMPATYEIVKPNGPLDCVWRNIVPHIEEQFKMNNFEVDKLKQALNPKETERYEHSSQVIIYFASHDNERLMTVMGNMGLFGDEALRRIKLAATLQLTAMGIPMIFMGDEFGEYKAQGTENKSKTVNKLEWSLLQNELNHSLFDTYRTLIELRKRSQAIRGDNIEFFH